MFELDQESADIIDEVYFWAKDTQRRQQLDYDLLQILEENQMRFKSLWQLAEVLDRTTLKQSGL